MNAKIYSEALGEIALRYVEEAEGYPKADKAAGYRKRAKRPTWVKWCAAAACLVFLIGVGIWAVQKERFGEKIQLSEKSVRVTAKYTDKPARINTSANLMYLSQEEMFTEFETVIFGGTVVSVRNIELNFNGDRDYQALAMLRVDKVYRGACSVGETVSVLLPCPSFTDVWVEDSEVLGSMKEGTTGIFMPMVYTEDNSYYERNGARLLLKDLANYGFPDDRFVFIESEDGPVFCRYAYPDIEHATGMKEVEVFVERMVEEIK